MSGVAMEGLVELILVAAAHAATLLFDPVLWMLKGVRRIWDALDPDSLPDHFDIED